MTVGMDAPTQAGMPHWHTHDTAGTYTVLPASLPALSKLCSMRLQQRSRSAAVTAHYMSAVTPTAWLHGLIHALLVLCSLMSSRSLSTLAPVISATLTPPLYN